jgi:hypothetical protein
MPGMSCALILWQPHSSICRAVAAVAGRAAHCPVVRSNPGACWSVQLGVHLLCSQLLALHRTATLRHDSLGQETLLNLLLRNHLAFNLYDQVLHEPATTRIFAMAPI